MDMIVQVAIQAIIIKYYNCLGHLRQRTVLCPSAHYLRAPRTFRCSCFICCLAHAMTRLRRKHREPLQRKELQPTSIFLDRNGQDAGLYEQWPGVDTNGNRPKSKIDNK